MLTAVLLGGRRYSSTAVAVVLWTFGYLVLAQWAMVHISYDIWGALFIAPVLGVISLAVMTRTARREGDPKLVRIMQWAVIYKAAMTLARYFMIEVVYRGAADASQYHAVGGRLAESYRQFDFIQPDTGRLIGTNFIEILTGVIYALTGKTRLGGFFIFSWFSLMGLFLLYRAFCIAVPEGQHRRYALLVLFMPTLAFWPSSIGKDAWMLLWIGVAAYGAAYLLRGRPRGGLFLVAGLAGTAMVRPHITLMLFVGLVAAYLIRRPERRTALGPVSKALGLALLLLGGAVVAHSVQSFFNVDGLDSGSVQTVLEHTQEQSTKGGSQYDPVNVGSGAGLVLAPVTVLFRPFPFEAHSLESLIASAEGSLLLLLLVLNHRRVRAAVRAAPRAPYLVLAGLYAAMFVFAFSSVGNFGILARQRAQVLPFVFAFIAVPAAVARRAVGPQPSPVGAGREVVRTST